MYIRFWLFWHLLVSPPIANQFIPCLAASARAFRLCGGLLGSGDYYYLPAAGSAFYSSTWPRLRARAQATQSVSEASDPSHRWAQTAGTRRPSPPEDQCFSCFFCFFLRCGDLFYWLYRFVLLPVVGWSKNRSTSTPPKKREKNTKHENR